MTPERWHRVEEVFGRAIDLPTGERSAFVTDACAGDLELAREVASLLEYANDSTALETAITAAAVAVAGRAVGTVVGPYRLVEVLGAGGMGTVYRAVRDDGQYDHTVAIKLLLHEAVPPRAIARFATSARSSRPSTTPASCTSSMAGPRTRARHTS